MSTELILGFLGFAAAMLFSPGPNNLMLMTSGLNFGFARTLPHALGVPLGFGFMVFAVGLGLGAVFAAYPVLYAILKFVGAAYLIYLAWRIATATGVHGESTGRPFTFLQAAAFQWVNAKAWVIGIGAITAYAGIAAYPVNVGLIAASLTVLGIVSAMAWLLFGTVLKRLVSNPNAVRIFNLVMAALLVASLIPVFLEG